MGPAVPAPSGDEHEVPRARDMSAIDTTIASSAMHTWGSPRDGKIIAVVGRFHSDEEWVRRICAGASASASENMKA